MHHGKNKGSKKLIKPKIRTLNENRGKLINFAEIGEFINFVDIGGMCNIYHWLWGVDAPGDGSKMRGRCSNPQPVELFSRFLFHVHP